MDGIIKVNPYEYKGTWCEVLIYTHSLKLFKPHTTNVMLTKNSGHGSPCIMNVWFGVGMGVNSSPSGQNDRRLYFQMHFRE